MCHGIAVNLSEVQEYLEPDLRQVFKLINKMSFQLQIYLTRAVVLMSSFVY